MAAPTPGSTNSKVKVAPDRVVVPDVTGWRAWLDTHEDTSDGVRLVLARKGATAPTTLTYAEALEEALCSGWIDGRRNRIDDATFQLDLPVVLSADE